MFPLSKVWGWWLLIGQVVNGLIAALAVFMSVPDTAPELLLAWKANALAVHGALGFAMAGFQAFTRSLKDEDGDGIPDIFQSGTRGGGNDGAG